MPMVGAAAAAHDVEVGKQFVQGSILLSQFFRISLVQVVRFVQFGVAFSGGIGAYASYAFQPWLIVGEHVVEMLGVRAVDHVVRGSGIRCIVHGLDNVL